LAAIADAATLHQQLRKTIQERITLTDDEAKAYAALRERIQVSANGGPLEWDAVRSVLGNAVEAGRLLARLADKHRLRVHVEVIEG
ncbi:MAG: hypothetical protein ACRDIY_17850, partial [Chloroflexota bacterium]